MATFYVLTHSDSVVTVEADNLQRIGGVGYEFTKAGQLVAFFDYHAVMGVVDETVYRGPFPADDEDTDDVCLDCRFQEFLDSDEFIEAVLDVVEAFNSADEPGDPAPAEYYEKPTIQVRRVPSLGSEPYLGVSFRDRFYGFGPDVTHSIDPSTIDDIALNPDQWAYDPLSKTSLVWDGIVKEPR